VRRETGKDRPISGIRLSDQLHRRAHVGGPRCRLTETRAYRALKSIEGQPTPKLEDFRNTLLHPDRTAVIPGGTGGTGGTAANSQTFGGTERWDRRDHHGRLPIRVDSPGRIGPTCQYHLFAPIPVEYHRSHPSPQTNCPEK
jgi:hypothetical protein